MVQCGNSFVVLLGNNNEFNETWNTTAYKVIWKCSDKIIKAWLIQCSVL